MRLVDLARRLRVVAVLGAFASLGTSMAGRTSSATGPSPVRVEPLCGTPDADPVAIGCALETGSFAEGTPRANGRLVVAAYNLERGFQADAQIRLLREAVVVPRPDVLLVSEADRGCDRTGGRNVARDLARGLGMNYVFGVEYVELPRRAGRGGRLDRQCEHGNAVLSRFPLENPRVLRHAVNLDWSPAGGEWWFYGEPRLGGRASVAADVRIGSRALRVYSVHLESGVLSGGDFRAGQAAELLADAAAQPHPVVVGGDFNWQGYGLDLHFGTRLEPAAAAFSRYGYVDAHRVLPPSLRRTRGPLVVDLIFGRGVVFGPSGICPTDVCDSLSDHLPVWASVRLP